MNEPRPGMDRREFLRGAARVAVGGALAGGVSLLVLRDGKTNSAGDCIRQIACGGCPELTGCPLPRAAGEREAARASSVNVEHPTSNIEHRTVEADRTSNVQRPTFNVQRSRSEDPAEGGRHV